MSNVFEEIDKKYKMYSTEGVNEVAIKEAESKLERKFSEEYRKYLSKYGAISFGSTELTGLNIDKYANVVTVTLNEIKRNQDFPKDCIVLEQIGIEGILMLTDTKGNVLEWQDGRAIKRYDSMQDYMRTKI